jgi:cation diffusion facilitator CzcD-associated flavoprotein CzcO
LINTDTIIIGAGPAGISLASLLSKEDVPFLLLEKSENVGSSWRGHYDRLHLHTVKSFSHLPLLPFPDSYPRYVSRDLLVSYFESYISKFNISPIFNSEVKSITKVEKSWKVDTNSGEYTAKRVVVATGYNNTPYFPEWESLKNYSGNVIHSKNYKNGSKFKDKKNNVVDKDLTNNAICFEGNYVYHRASKLCKNQKRVMLSCQYVTDNSMSFINQARIKLKDYAFIGKLF